MPDVKSLPCDYSPAVSSAGCSMDLEPCFSELPDPLSVLGPPLSGFPNHGKPSYNNLDAPVNCYSPGSNNNLLSNMGIQYCATSNAYPLKQPEFQSNYQAGQLSKTCSSSGNSRMYHSLENLHWNADPGVYTYRSVESEFVLHCTPSSQWYDGSPQGSQVYSMIHSPESFYPRRGLLRKDLPLFPQWLFPAVEDWGMNGNARKGLRDKLRLQSTRVTEPLKPLRPQPLLGNTKLSCGSQKMESLGCFSSSGMVNGQRELCARRITNTEEIKQEVIRRLQLRRQRSTPNLAFNSNQESNLGRSSTSELLSSTAQSTLERKRPPIGRLHIPTFEEFKRMRQKETARLEGQSRVGDCEEKAQVTSVREVRQSCNNFEDASNSCSCNKEDLSGASSAAEASDAPICTGPVPRSPLHSQNTPVREGNAEQPKSPECNDPAVPHFPPKGASSCCTAILLDGTDLSSYGAHLYKMKEGLLGSALGLIKKSCSAELSTEAPVRLPRDQHKSAEIITPQPGCQSACVSITTPACRQETCTEGTGRERGHPGECQISGSGCRRSSSDATYDPDGSVRAQRECRLRPHVSDPMPTDAAKRKQLEMKIAAAARLQSHRRGRDSTGTRLVRGHSEPRAESHVGGLGLNQVCQHRWSTVSSVSADSGVMGLCDDREDEEQLRQTQHTTGAEVERVDSGIDSGLTPGWKKPLESFKAWEARWPCLDCGHRDTTQEGGMCEKCSKLRTERKEAILEFLNTESSYGEDLRIIKEEFYCPMQNAGLLTAEQLTVVFGNVQELIDVNERFTEHLQDSIDQAFDQGDDDVQTVCIGKIFLEFVNMLPAFQTYCLQQSTSVNMLNTLEKEKELLRIFLDVSQNDNTALRRMNLRSFLIAPLQRVTKYPLLLSRIIKATNECHPDYSHLKEAKSRVESHLEHINMKSRQEGTATWSLRSFRRDSRKNREVINIEIRETSLKLVGWARESTRFIMEGLLQLSQPADGQWVKKGSKSLKFQNVQSLLMVRTADRGVKGDQTEVFETVQDGVLVLIKDKSSGKFAVLREPIHLANCVVSADPDCDDTFEVLDIRREAFVFRASDKSRTQQWYRQIKRYACDLGLWRKRRNALPNIMINTTQSRS
ncbi:uncharacterized protein si:dkey-91i10.2 [Trichomycterus rosablanca]|uniref:uncharacterized protein si:dkey-91i10.2 n=1 Tax=Trichomycterus rosablanca TaxID=2290929 RepID=UPI002F35EDBC